MAGSGLFGKARAPRGVKKRKPDMRVRCHKIASRMTLNSVKKAPYVSWSYVGFSYALHYLSISYFSFYVFSVNKKEEKGITRIGIAGSLKS